MSTSLRREYVETLRLAGPVVGSQLGQMSMGFVDTLMVGRLGPEALAGVALGSTIFFFIAIMSMGVVLGVSPMVSQAFGANDDDGVGRSTRQGLWMGLVLGIPAFLLIYEAGFFLRLIGQDPETVALTEGYLKAIAWGIFPFLWIAGLRSFVEGISNPLPVTIAMFIGVALNILFNYTLMFGKFGFPALGLVGTGWASTLVYSGVFIILALYVQTRRRFSNYKIFSRLRRPDLTYFRELFRIGWPIGASMGVEAGLFSATVMLMGYLGTVSLAAHQVAIQCAAFTFMVPLGFGLAGTVRVGQAVGRQDADGVRRAGYVAIALALMFMALAATAFWVIPRPIIGLYLQLNEPANAEVIQLAVVLLGIAAVFQLFDGLQVTAIGALRGLKDTRGPMVIGIISYWLIGLTSGYVFGFQLDAGAVGLWWGLVLGLAVASGLLVMRFRQKVNELAVSSSSNHHA